MFKVDIKTKYNVIHIAVENLSDLDEILAMPYIISYTTREVIKTNYNKLRRIEDNEQRVLRKSRGSYTNSTTMDKHRPSR